MALPAGTTIGPYEIVSPLGSGGMGEVYLARDSRLRRSLAIKVHRDALAADDSARRRFGQEAQAASALNHPNIVTIFDVGHQDGLDFIAMEHVEGRTLRDLLSDGAIDAPQALGIIAQAAAGLAAAHEAGVVHRDIKPENLIVARNGLLKILDFGLAKHADRQAAPLGGHTATATQEPALTELGTILGTTAYMSPEQARGLPLDRRTDIFSLGLVLYEALTGVKAFDGPSYIDVLHAILNDDPRPATEVNTRLPLEVLDVLGKALAKDPADRYHDAGDLALDLRRLKQGLEARSLPSLKPAAAPRAAGASRWSAAALLLAGLAVGGGAVWLLARSPARPETPSLAPADLRLIRVTSDPGFEGDPTLSSDGEMLAYTSDRTGNFEIFVRQVAGGADVNVTNDSGADVQPSFSPDGRQIAFVSTRNGAPDLKFTAPRMPMLGGDVWVVPALGGNARRVAAGGNFPSWSPDGRDLIYTSGPWFDPKLFRVSASGGEPREIPLEFGTDVRPSHVFGPHLSSDGRWIVLSTGDDVFVVSAGGGSVIPVARGQLPAWGPGSRSIVYTNGDVGTNQSLWTIGFDPVKGAVSGPAHSLTVGPGADLSAAMSADGRRLAFAVTTVSTQIESQPFDPELGRAHGAPIALTSSNDTIYFFDPSRDGRSALFELWRGPVRTIWRSTAGGQPVELTADPEYDNASPLWSPDGSTIAFSRRPSRDPDAAYGLWMMAADGANPRQLIERLGLNGIFSWLPDGRGIVHVGPGRQLYVLDVAARSERRLTNEPGIMPLVAISSDGRWVVYQCVSGASVDLHAVPIEGGGTARVVVAGPAQDYHPWVSPSGRWVYYLPDHKDLYRVPGPAQDWRSAPPERITDWHLTPISFVETPQLSRDGRQLLYSRGRITSDIWMATMSK